jgi:hypothetical protein
MLAKLVSNNSENGILALTKGNIILDMICLFLGVGIVPSGILEFLVCRGGQYNHTNEFDGLSVVIFYLSSSNQLNQRSVRQ